MTKFTIKSDILQRFTSLYKSLDPKAPEDLKVLRIEISNGKIMLIGCNQYVACVELIGESKDHDEVCHIKINNSFIDSINKEVNIAGIYTFETLPELAISSVSTSDGDKFNDFIIWPDNSPLDNWRDWFTMSESKKGFMFCTLYQIQTLFETSPSGEIVFPEMIDSKEPVIVRDVNISNWLGTFIPAFDGKKNIKPAELPEWL